jgi:HSP20 family protein
VTAGPVGKSLEAVMSKHEKSKSQDQTPTTRSRDWGDLAERWLREWPRPEFMSDLLRNFDDTKQLMKVEEYTDGDHLVVRAEMPGIDPDNDVHISVSDHTLHLQAERRQESTTEDDGNSHSEFRYGSFARTITLPVGASDEDVKASYKDGILEVRIPIDQARAEARKVPVRRV